MKTIKLTKGQFAIVDDEDYEWLNQYKWRCEKHGRTFRAIRTSALSETPKGRTTILMHRQIMNAQPSQELDHQNGNALDNRQNNLRWCTRNQNCGNAKKRVKCSSRHKGVTWCKRTKKWLSQITCNYKNIHLGYFDDEIEAAKAYDIAAKKLFGKFARTNF